MWERSAARNAIRKSIAIHWRIATRAYYRGEQLSELPLPDQPLADPDDRDVTHTYNRREGVPREETRVDGQVFDAVVDYAFGTVDRYLTMVTRDAAGGHHISRLSYYHTSQGTGWGRSVLDATHPPRSRPADFQGETIGVRAGLAKCLYRHVTNPRTGQDLLGPEMADRAVGRERCHGPGGNHIAALEAHFPDLAIVNPAAAAPRDVTVKECNDCHVLEHRIRDGDPENPGWIRSQGIGWTRSRCNTESGGALGCVTCHDPHTAASAAIATDYEARCLKCHSASSPPPRETQAASTSGGATGPEARACPVSATSGCISCHMPSVPLGALHVKLTVHHIRVRGRQP